MHWKDLFFFLVLITPTPTISSFRTQNYFLVQHIRGMCRRRRPPSRTWAKRNVRMRFVTIQSLVDGTSGITQYYNRFIRTMGPIEVQFITGNYPPYSSRYNPRNNATGQDKVFGTLRDNVPISFPHPVQGAVKTLRNLKTGLRTKKQDFSAPHKVWKSTRRHK